MTIPLGHENEKVRCVSRASLTLGEAELVLGNFAAARMAAFAGRPIASAHNDWDSRKALAELTVIESIALSRLGQSAEARMLVAPVVDSQRARFARNHDDAQQRLDYAGALYALALVDAAQRGKLLEQAATIVGALPAEMRALKSTRLWQDRIEAERRNISPRD